MKRSVSRRVAALAVAAASSVALSGCGLGSAGGFAPTGTLAGPLANIKHLDGATVSVGAKQFTEQLILGKMTVILLQSAGADVKDYTGIPGSVAARQAMLKGQIDLAWEYTGTAWIGYMGHTTPLKSSDAQYEAVRKEDATNHLTWLPKAPLNNTYAFAAREDVAKKFNVKTLSDLKKVPKKDRTFCVDTEFAAREDGFAPMLKTYGIPLGSGVPRSQVMTIDAGAIYTAVDNRKCNFGEIFTTDGRIKALNLKVLDDNKQFFPIYNGAPVIRDATLNQDPQIRQLLAPVTAKLTDDVMIDLNAQVDVDGKDATVVANDWLKKEGFIK